MAVIIAKSQLSMAMQPYFVEIIQSLILWVRFSLDVSRSSDHLIGHGIVNAAQLNVRVFLQASSVF